MPKEYINYPEPETYVRADDGVDVLPAAPQVGIHWDGSHETVQLSFDMDVDVLVEIVKARNAEPPESAFCDKPGRAVFYTGALSRSDLQRLIRHSRRARDAVFGSDE